MISKGDLRGSDFARFRRLSTTIDRFHPNRRRAPYRHGPEKRPSPLINPDAHVAMTVVLARRWGNGRLRTGIILSQPIRLRSVFALRCRCLLCCGSQCHGSAALSAVYAFRSHHWTTGGGFVRGVAEETILEPVQGS